MITSCFYSFNYCVCVFISLAVVTEMFLKDWLWACQRQDFFLAMIGLLNEAAFSVAILRYQHSESLAVSHYFSESTVQLYATGGATDNYLPSFVFSCISSLCCNLSQKSICLDQTWLMIWLQQSVRLHAQLSRITAIVRLCHSIRQLQLSEYTCRWENRIIGLEHVLPWYDRWRGTHFNSW